MESSNDFFNGRDIEKEIEIRRYEIGFEELVKRLVIGIYPNKNYDLALEVIRRVRLKPSTELIEAFSKSVDKLECESTFRWSMGLYLSALINSLPEGQDDLHLRFPRLKTLIAGLGIYMKTDKALFIHSDVEMEVGHSMKSGNLFVKGSAGWGAGYGMEGGCLTVYNDAGDVVGGYMSGGKIIISGDAGEDIGCGMSGGEIHLNGNYESISPRVRGGSIYHSIRHCEELVRPKS